MQKLGLITLIYNLICVSFSNSNWYANYYNIIDILDIPLYLISAFVFFRLWYFNFKGLSEFYKHCFFASYILLFWKVIYMYTLYNYDTFKFFYLFIIAIPIIIEIEKKINK